MGTSCRIGIKRADGTIKSIYCHCNGYPAGVGKTLKKDYADVDKVNELMDLGDIFCLGNEPVSKPEYWKRRPELLLSDESYTLAYKDRGEKGVKAKVSKDFYDFINQHCFLLDYVYVFDSDAKEWQAYRLVGIREIGYIKVEI